MSEEKHKEGKELIEKLNTNGLLTRKTIGKIYEDPYLITKKLDSLSRIYTTAIEQNDIAVIEKVNKKLIELIDKL